MSRFKKVLSWDDYQEIKVYLPKDLWEFFDSTVAGGIINRTPCLKVALFCFNRKFPGEPLPKILKGVKLPLTGFLDLLR